MEWIAAAAASLAHSLDAAGSMYHDLMDSAETKFQHELLARLSKERLEDSSKTLLAAQQDGLEVPNLELDAGPPAMQTKVDGAKRLPTSVLKSRILKSERALEQTTNQLFSIVETPSLKEVLGATLSKFGSYREEINLAFRVFEKSFGKLVPREGSAPKTEPGQEFLVWFATNREQKGKKFTEARSNKTVHGQAKVFVPEKRPIGSLGPKLFRHPIFGRPSVTLGGIKTLDEKTFWSLINEENRSCEECDQHALVFLHGYNVSFRDAARRTAQLKADLDFAGPTAFFSWPSLGTVGGYLGDAASIEASEGAIRDFLVNFAKQTGVREIHLIAHSMGNRGLLRAFASIAQDAASATAVRFGQVILAAPDVDRDLFKQLATSYGQLSKRSTLYVSENDKAIGVSAALHRFARVGLAPPVTVLNGIDTINVSEISLDFWGHGYVSKLRAVLSDIHTLINHDTPPDGRFGITRTGSSTEPHWEFLR